MGGEILPKDRTGGVTTSSNKPQVKDLLCGVNVANSNIRTTCRGNGQH